MKKIGLSPENEENLKKSLINDITGRNKNIISFIDLLNRCENDTWTIAIDGKWGAGKTFFVKQCKYILDHLKDEETLDVKIKDNILNKITTKPNYKTIYFDSWKNDNEIDPLVSLTKCIMSANKKTNVKVIIDKIAPLLDTILRVSAMFQSNIRELKDIKDILQINDTRSEIEKLNDEFDKLIGNGERLVIFIDELDRCRPSYAVNLLERIQHCFTNDKITFVFSVNLAELSKTVRKFYGNDFNGDGYLQRFFDIVLPIPEPDLTNYYGYTEQLNNKKDAFDKYCKSIAKYFNFSLRELNRYYLRVSLIKSNAIRLLKSPTKTYWDNEINELLYDITHFIMTFHIEPYLVALKMIDEDKYNEFINGNDNNNITEFLYNAPFIGQVIKGDKISGIKEIYEIVFDGKKVSNFSKATEYAVYLLESGKGTNYSLSPNFEKIKEELLNDISLIYEIEEIDNPY